MAKLSRIAGTTSHIFQIFIADSSSTTGAGLTGLVFNSGSLTAYYHRNTDTTATAISLVTMTVGTFTSSGFKEIDATNMPGWYQLCPPDAAMAAGATSVAIHLKGATNMAPLPIEVDLATQVDVRQWLGTAVTAATAGIPDTNVKNMNNVAATSITTINANQGTTQPINFTGTAGSALAKSDMVDIAGAAVSTSTAQIGVNTVNLGGTAQTGRDIGASVLLSTGTGTGQLDFTSGVVKANLAQILGTALTETAGQIAAAFKQFFNIASPTSTMNVLTTVTTATTATNLTNAPTNGDFTAAMKTSLNAATPASVTGAVGSVTGNVGGNVVGSVASVTARVTANTDQLAGQTVTAAAGVTFPTSVASPTNITAGTITTTTNLTNAPTAGDFTATMKTSLNAATPAVTVSDKTGFSLSSAGAGAIWDASLASHLTSGSTGAGLNSASSSGDPWNTALPGSYGAGTAGNIVAAVKTKTDTIPASPAAVGSAMTLTSGERDSIAAALLDLADGIETGTTPRQALRLQLAALAGKISGSPSGPIVIRNTADTKNRISATVDANGNRTAITLDAT